MSLIEVAPRASLVIKWLTKRVSKDNQKEGAEALLAPSQAK